MKKLQNYPKNTTPNLCVYICVVLLLLTCTTPLSAQTFPAKPSNYVSDLSEVLTFEQAKHLNDTLAYFEQKTSNQVFVLIADTLDGLKLEDATIQIAEKWGIGQEEFDNGVLLAVFLKDRKLRIEVGYGLEGDLPDLAASNIITYTITPRFKEDKIYEGIRNGVYQIMARTDSAYIAEMAILSKKREAEYELRKIEEDAEIKRITKVVNPVYAIIFIGWCFPLFYLLTWLVFIRFRSQFPEQVNPSGTYPTFNDASSSKLFYQRLRQALGIFSALLILDALFFQLVYNIALAIFNFANEKENIFIALPLFGLIIYSYVFIRRKMRRWFKKKDLAYIVFYNFLFSVLVLIPVFIFRYYEFSLFLDSINAYNYSLYYTDRTIWDTVYWGIPLIILFHFYIYRQPKWWFSLKGGSSGGSYSYSSKGSSSSSSSWGSSSSSSSSWGSSSKSSSSSSSSPSSSSYSSGSSSFGGGGGGSFGGGGASGSW